MGEGNCDSLFLNYPIVSDSALWTTTNTEYGNFYRIMRQEVKGTKGLHAEYQKKCGVLTKELRDCQTQLELLRLRLLPEPTAEDRVAASPEANQPVRSRSVSPRSYLEEHMKISGARNHMEKESEAQCDSISAHSVKVALFGGKERTSPEKKRGCTRIEGRLVKEMESWENLESSYVKKKAPGKTEDSFSCNGKVDHSSVRANDLERKDVGKEKNLKGGKKNYRERLREMREKDMVLSGKCREIGRQFSNNPKDQEGYQWNRVEQGHSRKPRQTHKKRSDETAPLRQHSRVMDHSGRVSLKSPFIRIIAKLCWSGNQNQLGVQQASRSISLLRY